MFVGKNNYLMLPKAAFIWSKLQKKGNIVKYYDHLNGLNFEINYFHTDHATHFYGLPA